MRPPVQGRQDQARHLPPVRQRALPAGQPERPVGPRADAEPAELHQGQRHARHERPHGPDLAHGRRDPQLADRPLPGPARAGRLELVRLLPARRLGRLLVDRSSTGRTTPTAATRRTTRRRRPRTRTTTWSTPTRRRSAARARCATRPRRGCRTRAPAATSAASALANIELENNTAIITRSTGNTTLAAASAVGRDEHQGRERRPTSPPGRRSSSRTGEPSGRRSVASARRRRGHRQSPSPRRSRRRILNGGAVTVVRGRSDRRHDEGLRRRLARVDRGRGTRRSRRRARPPARTRADRLRRHRDPLRRRRRHLQRERRERARPTRCPTRPAATPGSRALFGAKYVNPAINHGNVVRQRHRRRSRSPTRSASAASRASTGCSRRTRSARSRRCRRPASRSRSATSPTPTTSTASPATIHHAYGPGEAGYVQQLKDYDTAFGKFFTRLQNDGITKDNTLFVVTVEEGDHFAGTAPDDAACDGVTHARARTRTATSPRSTATCKRLVATYNASHGTSATTNFSVHSDMAPNVYITGQPGAGLGDRPRPREGDVAT